MDHYEKNTKQINTAKLLVDQRFTLDLDSLHEISFLIQQLALKKIIIKIIIKGLGYIRRPSRPMSKVFGYLSGGPGFDSGLQHNQYAFVTTGRLSL